MAPFGREEGTEAPPAKQELGLVVGEPVQFRFFESATRRDDTPGTMLDRIGDDLAELPAIEATMPADGRVARFLLDVEGQLPGALVVVQDAKRPGGAGGRH